MPDVGRFADDFLLYWASIALYLSRTGKLTFDCTYDRRRTDNLTKGLARHAARNAVAAARRGPPAAPQRTGSPSGSSTRTTSCSPR